MTPTLAFRVSTQRPCGLCTACQAARTVVRTDRPTPPPTDTLSAADVFRRALWVLRRPLVRGRTLRASAPPDPWAPKGGRHV